MKESALLKLALICSLIGIILLYFVSQIIGVEEVNVEKITHGNVGEVVKIMGNVKSVTVVNNITFLKIEKPEMFDVVLFKNLEISEGDYVEVIGEIEEYKGKREIIGNAIRVIS